MKNSFEISIDLPTTSFNFAVNKKKLTLSIHPNNQVFTPIYIDLTGEELIDLKNVFGYVIEEYLELKHT